MKKGVSGHAGIIIEGEIHPRLASVNKCIVESLSERELAIDSIEYCIRVREPVDLSPIALLRHDLIERTEQLLVIAKQSNWW